MESKETPHKRGSGQVCNRCRRKRRGCRPSEFDPNKCANCHEARAECSQSTSRTTPSRDAKRKVEEIGDTPERDSVRSKRATSSTTVSHDPHDLTIVSGPKKLRYENLAQILPQTPILPQTTPRKLSRNHYGICRQTSISSGEAKGDSSMIKCIIENCPRWCHLSCVLFTEGTSQIFYSFAAGTHSEGTVFICLECLNPEREDLANAAMHARAEFTHAMEQINQAAKSEKEGWPQQYFPSLPQDQGTLITWAHKEQLLHFEEHRAPEFEPAREERYQGFQLDKINSLLANIEGTVYEYDREISWTNRLVSNDSDLSIETPLKVWSQIDPGQHFLAGNEWCMVDGRANNLSESHAPITAALRRRLGTPDDKSLYISADLQSLTFSQVHSALINWFVFDILNNELNIYHFSNMKPLKAMMSAVANFGDARWNGSGRQVLREVQLRAWHKDQFREEVIENVGWQGELIGRFEAFLEPLNRRIGKIDPWSPSRANIIKHTIELWSYLDAANGKFDVFHPAIGRAFDGSLCENVEEELQSRQFEIENMKVGWIMRRGFRYREGGMEGKAMVKKALTLVKG